MDNNDLSVTLTANRVIPEAISELQTQVQAYSSEFGRNSGAQIMAVTRSGSNVFHGEVWDYYRGNWMEPVGLLNKRAGVNATPRYVHNQAGADAAGHIIRNKTFFFALYEANIRREAPNANNSTAATIVTPTGLAALGNVALGQNQTTESRQRMLGGINFLKTIHPLVANYTNLRDVRESGRIHAPFRQRSDAERWAERRSGEMNL